VSFYLPVVVLPAEEKIHKDFFHSSLSLLVVSQSVGEKKNGEFFVRVLSSVVPRLEALRRGSREKMKYYYSAKAVYILMPLFETTRFAAPLSPKRPKSESGGGRSR
jgi:hypothetical protein